MHQIPILIALALVARAWWDFVGAKWRARGAARNACREAGMDFIDELALSSWRLEWRRGPQLRRRYDFEFCADGPVRYHGQVEMVGHLVTRIHLDPYPDEGRGTG